MDETAVASPSTTGEAGLSRWLLAFALAYGVLHHQGFLFGGLGTVEFVADGGTRLADWLDLLTPFAVIGPAVGAFVVAGWRSVPVLVVFVTGAVLYVEGHGIHLAANSVANEQVAAGGPPSPVVHLWDEPVGHHLWFAGLALVVVGLVAACHGRWRIGSGWLLRLLGLQFGVTWATNGLEGGTAIFSGLVALGFLVWSGVTLGRGAADRPVPELLVWAFAPALTLIAGYGVVHGGFPQPSEIGWGVFG